MKASHESQSSLEVHLLQFNVQLIHLVKSKLKKVPSAQIQTLSFAVKPLVHYSHVLEVPLQTRQLSSHAKQTNLLSKFVKNVFCGHEQEPFAFRPAS